MLTAEESIERLFQEKETAHKKQKVTSTKENCDKLTQPPNESPTRTEAPTPSQPEMPTTNPHVTKIVGDGNCLFRSVALGHYGTSDELTTYNLRFKTITEIYNNWDIYSVSAKAAHNVETREEYITYIGASGVWGDEPEIKAMTEALHISIQVNTYTPFYTYLHVGLQLYTCRPYMSKYIPVCV